MNKNLVTKSVLTRNAIRILKENRNGVSSGELARELFRMEKIPNSLAEKMMVSLLGEDSRFVKSKGQWFFKSLKMSLDVRIANTTFVVLDVEMIGRGKSSKIVEIAAFKIKENSIRDEFCSLVNPGRPLSPGLFEPSRFSGEDLEKAPEVSSVLQKFADFIDAAVLVAHNAGFDIRILDLELSRLSHFQLGMPVIDTLKLSRKWLPGLDAYNLPQLAAYFGVDLDQHHRARSDALTLSRIFMSILHRLENQGVYWLKDLQNSFLT